MCICSLNATCHSACISRQLYPRYRHNSTRDNATTLPLMSVQLSRPAISPQLYTWCRQSPQLFLRYRPRVTAKISNWSFQMQLHVGTYTSHIGDMELLARSRWATFSVLPFLRFSRVNVVATIPISPDIIRSEIPKLTGFQKTAFTTKITVDAVNTSTYLSVPLAAANQSNRSNKRS